MMENVMETMDFGDFDSEERQIYISQLTARICLKLLDLEHIEVTNINENKDACNLVEVFSNAYYEDITDENVNKAQITTYETLRRIYISIENSNKEEIKNFLAIIKKCTSEEFKKLFEIIGKSKYQQEQEQEFIRKIIEK